MTRKVRIGDIADINSNLYSKKDKWKDIYYLDTGNITKNEIDNIQHIDLAKEKLPCRAKRKVKKNSIIYSTVRPNQQHFGIIKEHCDNFLVSTGFAVIDVKSDKTSSDYVYYTLTQPSITEFLQSIAEQSVSTYPAIKSSDIENLEIAFPPLNEQIKIAKLLRAFDDKIESNKRANDILQQQAELLFADYFLRFDSRPSGWRKGNLLDIADYTNGLAMQRFRPNDGEVGLPVLKIKELRQGFCDKDSELCSPTVNSNYIVYDGDVIFSWSGSLLVDFWCGGKCGLNQHLFKVTSSRFNSWFTYSWTNYHLAKFIAIAADKATTMGHIKCEDLAKSEVLIPSEEDYKNISDMISPLYSQIICNRIENRRLETLRDTLLPKLMSGEIDVSDVEI